MLSLIKPRISDPATRNVEERKHPDPKSADKEESGNDRFAGRKSADQQFLAPIQFQRWKQPL